MKLSPTPRFGALVIEETGRISNTNMPLYDYRLTNDTRCFALDAVVLQKRGQAAPLPLASSQGIAGLCRELGGKFRVESLRQRLFEILKAEYESWNIQDSELLRKFKKGITQTGLLLDDTAHRAESRDQITELVFSKPVRE